MKNEVVFVFITDNNYIMPTCVSIVSLIKNKNYDSVYNINILTENITKENMNLFNNFINEYNNNEIIIKVHDIKNQYRYNDKIKEHKYVSKSALLKFNIANLFQEYDKILYLDSDIIILSDLKELFETDINNYYAAVVKDYIATNIEFHNEKFFSKDYFNTGMMLLNIKLLREDKISDKLLEYKLNDDTGHFMDQDSFNYVFNGKVKFVPHKYNYMITNNVYSDIHTINNFYEYDLCEDDINILHLTYKKPWSKNTISYNRYYDYFWEYYQYTSWFKDNPMLAFLSIIRQNFNNINNKMNILNYKLDKIIEKQNSKIKLFGIENFYDKIIIYFFGIKITIKKKNYK